MFTTAIIVALFKALVVLSVLVLILGLIKPKWVLFWAKEPNRILASGVALVMFMGSMTGWSYYEVKPKAKTERERTNEELNTLNLDRTGR